MGFCRADFSADRVSVQADHYDLDLALTRSFDLPIVSVGVGLGGGASLLRQTFETAGIAPPRNTLAGHGTALLSLRWDLPRGFFVLSGVAAQVLIFAQQRGNEADARTTAVPVAQLRLGLGKWF
jgi:hypothetical protein